MCITYIETDNVTGKKRLRVISGDDEEFIQSTVQTPLDTIKKAAEKYLADNPNCKPINVKIGGL